MAEGQEIATIEPRETLPTTPMEMLARALDRGADLSVMEKLMDLQERHEKNQARKAFDAAVADAKSKIKPVTKNRTGHNNKRYADFSAYAKEIDPVLAAHGLSYRFRTDQDGAVKVTCILSHRDGHSEETTLAGPADTTGNKNSIQAIGSTLTYLQRYSLCAALGLAATEDDDGQASSGDEPITPAQLKELQELKDKSGADLPKFCAYFKIDALPDLRQSQFQNAKAALQAKVAAKKKAKAQPEARA